MDAHTLLEVTTEARTLIVRPAEANQDERAVEVAERVMTVHDETLNLLAR